jgi:hypothetical protein
VTVTIAAVTPEEFEALVIERANKIKNLDTEIAEIPFELILESEQLKYKYIARMQLRSQFTILPSFKEPKTTKVLIRGIHRNHFRSGEWAELQGFETVTPPLGLNPRECYIVQFPDGVGDSWAVDDHSITYEFKDVSTYES